MTRVLHFSSKGRHYNMMKGAVVLGNDGKEPNSPWLQGISKKIIILKWETFSYWNHQVGGAIWYLYVLKLTKQVKTRSQMELKNEEQSRMECYDKSWVNTDKDKTVDGLLKTLVHTVPQQGCDWCSSCSWTFSQYKKAIKHKHSLMLLASGSLLPEEPLSVTVYNVMPKVNCVLTTLSHRKDHIALQN